ncbi:hypothetical protein [Pseudomonas azotoformans]|nr:hypothetical protein [Pseudomonas azotoformans]OIN51962.1 hypothetical protein BFL39_04640 [Pseudomonas azotoformans]SDO61644.1 hypothetical protein SAMN04489799_5083 [Pseudomonas azotoformans]
MLAVQVKENPVHDAVQPGLLEHCRANQAPASMMRNLSHRYNLTKIQAVTSSAGTLKPVNTTKFELTYSGEYKYLQPKGLQMQFPPLPNPSEFTRLETNSNGKTVAPENSEKSFITPNNEIGFRIIADNETAFVSEFEKIIRDDKPYPGQTVRIEPNNISDEIKISATEDNKLVIEVGKTKYYPDAHNHKNTDIVIVSNSKDELAKNITVGPNVNTNIVTRRYPGEGTFVEEPVKNPGKEGSSPSPSTEPKTHLSQLKHK